MLNKYNFHCPHCNTELNQNNTIVLQTLRENGDRGEIHLATSVGNYEYRHVPEIEFSGGELVEFVCPDCKLSLNSKEFDSYALLKLKVGENIVFDVLFSRKAGVQKTYLITEDGIESYTGN